MGSETERDGDEMKRGNEKDRERERERERKRERVPE